MIDGRSLIGRGLRRRATKRGCLGRSEAEVGKVTLKSNVDEALSGEFLLKSNGDEALKDIFL